MNSELIQRAAKDLTDAEMAVAMTGAGISVESGIPPFRGKGGLWEKIDPVKYAHIDSFMKDPAEVWNVLIKEMKNVLDRAKPNPAHLGLAKMEQAGILKTIITQNVDGLHQAAGNSDVIEFHGNFAWQRCIKCGKKQKTEEIDMSTIPPQCTCSGILRPDCVFFGETIPGSELTRSRQLSAECDLMLVIGTSAEVQPAAYMPVIAKRNGATIIEINPEPTLLTANTSDYLIQGEAGTIMEQIVAKLKGIRKK